MSAVIVNQYRYRLERAWAALNASGSVTWVMLNPSTADATDDDATIRKCIGFATRWGCASITVVNLFALRSRDPKALRLHPDPVGPANDAYIEAAIEESALTIAAWGGSFPAWSLPRVQRVGRMLSGRAHHIGLTNAGQPKHPLMQPYAAPVLPWVSR